MTNDHSGILFPNIHLIQKTPVLCSSDGCRTAGVIVAKPSCQGNVNGILKATSCGQHSTLKPANVFIFFKKHYLLLTLIEVKKYQQ